MVAQARRRMDHLRNRLASHPDFQELERLTQFVKTYDELAAKGASSTSQSGRGRRLTHPDLIPFVRKVLTEANGQPVATSEILEKAKSAGIEIGGKKPNRNLSARLSTDKANFKASADGKGWVLADAATGEQVP